MTVFNKDEALIFGGVSFYGFCQAQTFHLITSKECAELRPKRSEVDPETSQGQNGRNLRKKEMKVISQ